MADRRRDDISFKDIIHWFCRFSSFLEGGSFSRILAPVELNYKCHQLDSILNREHSG